MTHIPRHRRRTSSPHALCPRRKAELKAARQARAEALAPGGERLFAYGSLHLKGINFSPEHIRRLVAAGKFPAPIYIGQHRPRWRESVIDRWIAGLEQVQQSNKKEESA